MNTTIRSKLITFQKNMPLITKNAKNPFFKSDYATLDAIQASIQQPLADAGLGYMQTITSEGLLTTIFDTEGNYIDSTYPLSVPQGKPQEIASGVTYAKRYALVAMLGLIVSGEDDDGNQANQYSQDIPTIRLTDEQFAKALNANLEGIDAVLDTYSGKEIDGKRYMMKKQYKMNLEKKKLELQKQA